jgi:hypothetical protein
MVRSLFASESCELMSCELMSCERLCELLPIACTVGFQMVVSLTLSLKPYAKRQSHVD